MKPTGSPPVWTTWRCRRNANVFILSLAGLLASLILVGILDHAGFHRPWRIAGPLAAVGCSIWMMLAWRRRRTFHNQRAERGLLSRDERQKARSKLMKDRTWI